MTNGSERDYTTLAAEARQYGASGFMRPDNQARVPYGFLYRVASALEAQAAQSENLTNANLESLRSRIAALEAVIRECQEFVSEMDENGELRSDSAIRNIFLAPSVVLDQMIAEKIERIAHDFAEGAWEGAFLVGDVVDDVSAVQATEAWFKSRAADIRNGDA